MTIGFEAGVPVTVNGKSANALEIVKQLNEIGGRNGVGRIDMVENRFVGMKSRGVYESPGMTILYDAYLLLEQLTLDRDLTHCVIGYLPKWPSWVYYGFWYSAKFDALLAFNREAQKNVTGEVSLSLYKGNIDVDSRTSPNSCTTRELQRWKAAVRTTKMTPKDFCGFKGCPTEYKGAQRHGLISSVGLEGRHCAVLRTFKFEERRNCPKCFGDGKRRVHGSRHTQRCDVGCR